MKDWAAKWALYSPGKIALREYETGRSLTYDELNRLANRMANHLQREKGVEHGDRIAVLAEFCLEYIVLFCAAQKAGFILVPLNYRLAAPEIDFLLQDAGVGLLVVEEKFRKLVEGPSSAQNIPHTWLLEELRDFCDPYANSSDDKGFRALQPPADEDPVFILYTSGTTGFPKGALYTHKMLFWNSINTAMSLIVNSESRTINVMPPFHTGGWNVLTTPFLHHGAYSCLIKKFDPDIVLELLQQEQATLFMGVPTMLKMMADQPGFAEADFQHLHYIIVGGEPMPIPLIEQWHEKGVPVRQGYGMTEVGPNLTSLHQNDAIRKKGSIGRPNFYVDICIAGEDGRPLPPNQPGELWLKGPMVTPGYWRNETATAQAFQNGWFRTGDLVRQDEEHFLYVVDRIKNMFISGGENVYPAEVERVLLGCQGVSEAAVIGIPDEKWGEVGLAFIVRQTGFHLLEEQILEHCRQNLARFKVPRQIIFVEHLPKNDTGKINRKALRAC